MRLEGLLQPSFGATKAEHRTIINDCNDVVNFR